MVSHISSEAPVVGAVLEEIEQWHGAVGKPVNKLRLKEAFGIMETPATCSNTVKKFVPSVMRTNEKKEKSIDIYSKLHSNNTFTY